MSNVMIRGLMKVHNKNRRAANEQAQINHISVIAHTVVSRTVAQTGGEEVHGTFCYRGRTYTK